MSSISKLPAAAALLSILLMVAFTGCDDRNPADQPQQVYYLAGSYIVGSVMKDIDVDGDLLAVAALGGGAYVLNVADPSAITEVYHYSDPGVVFPERVAISELAGILAVFMPPDFADFNWGQGPLWNIAFTDSAIGSKQFSGPLSDLEIVVDSQTADLTLTFLATDLTSSDGFVGTQYVLNSSQNRWLWNSSYPSPNYAAPHGDIRGFDVSGENVVMACNEDGIHFKNFVSNTELSDLMTPGLAYDCAWYADYVIVADRYYLTVVDASNPAEPILLSSLTIPTADRLIRVEVDGSYACVMDEFDGVYIVDISNPADPVMLQEIRLNEPSAIRTGNNRLYISDEQQGLLIYSR